MKVGYARVSTDKREQAGSVDAQVDALRRAGCQKIIEERRSAFKGRRKKFEACKDLIASGKVTHFMVCSLSRNSRQGESKEMSRLCKANGVEFVILDGTQSDVTTPEGLLMVSIFDAVNEADSLIKGIAVKRGLDARRRAGATAAGNTPFGYMYDGTQPVPNPEQWDEAKKLWELLRENDWSPTRTLRLNPAVQFSVEGLYGWMRNPLLMGRPSYSDVEIVPLISPVEFQKVQRLLASRRKNYGSRTPAKIHLFTQSVTCKACGYFLRRHIPGPNRPRLRCMNVKCACYGRGISERTVKVQVISELQAAFPKMLAEAEKAKQTTDNQPTAAEIALRQKLDSLLRLQQSGVPSLEKSISATRGEIDSLAFRDTADWVKWAPLIRQKAIFEGVEDRELRTIISELVKQIFYIGNFTEVEVVMRDPS